MPGPLKRGGLGEYPPAIEEGKDEPRERPELFESSFPPCTLSDEGMFASTRSEPPSFEEDELFAFFAAGGCS